MKIRSGCQKQQHSNFGTEYLYDHECKHDHAIHVVKVDMTRIPTIYYMHHLDLRLIKYKAAKYELYMNSSA